MEFIKGKERNFKLNLLTATNGLEALYLFEKNNYLKNNESKINLIIMDIEMPVLDGLSATRSIK
jgi:CheY-like chemotaxis protein